MRSQRSQQFGNLFIAAVGFAAVLLVPRATAQDDIGELKYLEIKLLDPDGKPLPDATVEISIDNVSFPMMTDEEGIIPLNVPGKGASLRVSVKEEGYVALGTRWNKGDKIPDEFTIPMQKGTAIGGIVHDEDGNPIEGVEIEAHTFSNSRKAGDLRPYFTDAIATTDSEGRWKTETAPDESVQIQFRLRHDDFIQEESYGRQRATWDQLKSMDHIFTLQKGIEVAGKIIDPGGQPLVGATVGIGSSRFGGDNFQTTETDEKGEYAFKNVKSGATVLTVYAENWAPDLRAIAAERGMEPVNFQLELGHSIRIRVTDPQGEPVSGVWLAPDTWRGHRSVGGVMPRFETDASGIWESDSVPADEIDYDILKQGHMSVRDQKLAAREEEYVIVLPNPLVVQGNVVDSETGQPIKEFSLIQGVQWDAARVQVHWERYNIKTGYDGKYKTEFDEQRVGNLIRIEAAGYRPGVSRTIKSDEGDVTIDFKLEAGTGPSGIVKTPEGKLAKGATVAIATVNEQLQIYNGQFRQNSNSPSITTDVDGRFTLPFPDSEYLVIFLHDTGWKQLEGEQLEEIEEITLEPWAKIGGKVLQGKEPMAGENLQLHYQQVHRQNQPNVYWSYSATADNEGNFMFDRVKTGTANVGRLIQYGVVSGFRMSTYTHSEQVEVKPNETAQVQIGGVGRMIKGQFVVPDDYEGQVSWAMSTVNIHGQPPNAGVKNPLQTIGKAIAQLGQGTTKPKKPVHNKNYSGTIAEDGTFEIYDIQPGQYNLNVRLLPLPTSGNYNWNALGTFNESVTIAAGDEPLDLGKKTLTMTKPVVRPQGEFRLDFSPTPVAPAPAK